MNILTAKPISFVQMKKLNEEAGMHWFSKDTMRYWGTRLLGAPNRYNMFVTSEKEDDVRKSTIRMFNPKRNQVATIGDFFAFETAAKAHAMKEKIAKKLDELKDDSQLQRVMEDLYGAEWVDGKLVFISYGDKEEGYKQYEFAIEI
jgi:hypothetical protein